MQPRTLFSLFVALATTGCELFTHAYDYRTGIDASLSDVSIDARDAPEMLDVHDVADTLDVPTDVVLALPVPRARAPLSGSVLSGSRPELRWALGPGTDGAQVELCRDRACGTPVLTQDVSGSTFTAPAPLPAGTYFWRLRARAGRATGIDASAPWEFVVRARTTPVTAVTGLVSDYDGDGYADVAVGAPACIINTNDCGVGRVAVYGGSSAGVSAARPMALLMGPDAAPAGFGFALAPAGDVNGDGYGDLIVGAYRAEAYRGRAYVYFGGPNGPLSVPSVALAMPDASGLFGRAVRGLGDVNGDGYGDVLVGGNIAPNPAGTQTGRAYVYYGGPAGPAPNPSRVIDSPDGAFGNFGIAAAAGDIDGDGFADVVIGAHCAPATFDPNTGTVTCGAGRAHLYRGGPAGLGAAPDASWQGLDPTVGVFGYTVGMGDFTGDGRADLVVGAFNTAAAVGRVYLYASDGHMLSTTPSGLLGPPTGAVLNFGVAVDSAGDVNGDGVDDLAVGATCAPLSAGACGGGQMFVYSGGVASASGLSPTPSATFTGIGSYSYFGNALRGVGDVNGDGFGDVAVGASCTPGGGAMACNGGAAYVYLGTAAGLSGAAFTLPGFPGDRFGASIALAPSRWHWPGGA